MPFPGRSGATVTLSHIFGVRIRKINVTLISLVIHVGTMTYRFMMLSIELLERFHLAKVQIVALLVETVQLFRGLVFNDPLALLNGTLIQIRHIAILLHQSSQDRIPYVVRILREGTARSTL